MNNQTSWVVDVDEQNFEAAVLQESMQRPVIVDFWATWCGPCKTLGPLLEDLASQYAGAFVLAKIDVDKSPFLAEQFGAQSIPMVFAIFQGRPVDRFTGTLPKAELKTFVDAVVKKCGVEVASTGAPPELPGDAAGLQEHWRARLAERPDDGEALVGLGRALLAVGQWDAAVPHLERVSSADPALGAAQALLELRRLAERVKAAGGDAVVRDRLSEDEDSAEAGLLVGCADVCTGRFARGIGRLVDLSGHLSGVHEEARELAAVALGAVGRGDEEVEDHRRRLSRLLF